MLSLFENIEFWKTITAALGALAWPIAALTIFLLVRRQLLQLFARDNLIIKVAGMEINVADATKSIGTQLADLQKRVSELEGSLVNSNKDNGMDQIKPSLSEAITTPSRQRYSLLWVDDYPSNNAFLIEQFRKDGIDVDISISTSEAVEKIDRIDFDLIISDLGRLENGSNKSMAGLDLIRSVRKLGNNVPILIFAGDRALADKDKLMSAGAQVVTNSPVEVQKFVYQRSRGNI